MAEIDYGLEEYTVDPGRPIRVVMKRLYSDFVVQEIASDGTVVAFPSPSDFAILDERKKQSAKVEDANEEAASAPAVDCPLPEKLDEETAGRVSDAIQAGQSADIPVEGWTKDERRALHDWVRTKWSGKVESNNADGKIRLEPSGSGKNRGRKRERWTGRPDYVHFTLAKENKDTQHALGIIAKHIHLPNTRPFEVSGIKDRRAVTTQRVSAYRVAIPKLMGLNKMLRGIRVYNPTEECVALALGQHLGNRFKLVLREVEGQEDELELRKRAETLARHGFINYYGLQRFGSCDMRTDEVGRLMLAGKWSEAVDAILCSKSAPGTLGKAITIWLETKDAKKALDALHGGPAYASTEAQVLKSIAKGIARKDALMRLPRGNRNLYVHAYQSRLWNRAASRLVREARALVASGEPLFGDKSPELALVAKDLDEVDEPVRQWYKDWLKEDGVSTESLCKTSSEFNLSATRRPIIVRPTDLEVSFIRHGKPNEQLQPGLGTGGEVDESKRKGDGPMRAMLLAFSLPSGAYATCALRQITAADMGKAAQRALEREKAGGDVATAADAEKDAEDGDDREDGEQLLLDE